MRFTNLCLTLCAVTALSAPVQTVAQTSTKVQSKEPESQVNLPAGNFKKLPTIGDNTGFTHFWENAEMKLNPVFRIQMFEKARDAHRKGKGKEARELFTRLVTHADHVPSMKWLGRMAYRGEGQDEDQSQAYIWYLKAAEANETESMMSVGFLLWQGEGVEKSDTAALKWFIKAALLEDKRADEVLMKFYDEGIGTDASAKKAVVFAKRLVRRLEPSGYYYMGVAYRDGKAVAQDLKKSREMLELAKEYGHEEAEAALETLSALEAVQ